MGYSQPQARTAVVALSAQIDATNAPDAGSDLLAAVVPGVTAVVADMTATRFCDAAGVSMLAQVRQQAIVNLAELVLVVPSAAVLRALAAAGLDVMLPVYPSLAAALTPEPRPAAGATR